MIFFKSLSCLEKLILMPSFLSEENINVSQISKLFEKGSKYRKFNLSMSGWLYKIEFKVKIVS